MSTGDSLTFCPQTDMENDTGTVMVTAVCAVLVGLVVLATVVDMLLRFISTNGNQGRP